MHYAQGSYALDIETDTSGVLDDGVSKSGLDPRGTRITSIACYSEGGVFVFDDRNEARMMRGVNAWMMDPDTEPGIWVGFNDANFDIPFLLTRSEKLDVDLGIRARVHPDRRGAFGSCAGHEGGYVASWGDHDHIDLMYPYRAYAKSIGSKKYNLKLMGRHFGMDPIEVDRSAMQNLSAAEQCAYNISDVETTYRLKIIAQRVEARLEQGLSAHKNGKDLSPLRLSPWLDSLAA